MHLLSGTEDAAFGLFIALFLAISSWSHVPDLLAEWNISALMAEKELGLCVCKRGAQGCCGRQL